MAKRLELQIQGTSNFAFDVEGEWTPSRTFDYRRSDAIAPVLSSLRDTWTLRGCRIKTTDNSTDSLWVSVKAFLARFEDETAHPTYVRLVRDPDTAAEVLWTLGPTDSYEDVRFDSIEGEQDSEVEDASWRVTATFTIVVSAQLKKADANGIVGWRQQVSVSYPFGFRRLQWVTTITTIEGVSAITKAQNFARIPVSELGGDHAYDTNGPDGIDYVYDNADEQNSRIPTEVQVISIAQQKAEAVGVTSGQGSPSDFAHVVTREITAEEQITTTFAMAHGPAAASYVATKKPSGTIGKTVEVDRLVLGQYERTWTQRKAANAAKVEVRDDIRITITGGHRAQIWRAITGGRMPHHSTGSFKWWELTADISTFKSGSEDIDFPGFFSDPWKLQGNASQETEADIVGERQSDLSQNKYVRQAKLVFRSNVPDPFAGQDLTKAITDIFRSSPRVKSYTRA